MSMGVCIWDKACSKASLPSPRHHQAFKHKKGARSAPCSWISEGFIFQMQQEQAQRAPVFLFSVLLLHSAMACCKTKPPASLEDRGCCTCKSLAMTYFHTGIRTIIGAKSFHCPVRDGKEWGQLAMVTRHKLRCCGPFFRPQHKFIESSLFDCVALQLRACVLACMLCQSYRVKPHGQLVLVSSMHCCTCTPSLSTSWSTTTLQGAQGPGRSHLETSFALRCFQRLSLPHLATLQCHWRDNRYTRGVSTPVLSY